MKARAGTGSPKDAAASLAESHFGTLRRGPARRARCRVIMGGGTEGSCGEAAKLDIAIDDEVITDIAPSIDPMADCEIDAAGLVVRSGGVDFHVHFNEPGRTDWEGFATGLSALAAGGCTTFFDMPLNSVPPTTDAAAFGLKRDAAERSAIIDFGLGAGWYQTM